MIVEQVTGKEQLCIHYLQISTYAYNSFASPALNGLSLFQLTYGSPPKVLSEEK